MYIVRIKEVYASKKEVHDIHKKVYTCWIVGCRLIYVFRTLTTRSRILGPQKTSAKKARLCHIHVQLDLWPHHGWSNLTVSDQNANYDGVVCCHGKRCQPVAGCISLHRRAIAPHHICMHAWSSRLVEPPAGLVSSSSLRSPADFIIVTYNKQLEKKYSKKAWRRGLI